MDYQAVLFDLDGTLLPMDQDQFVEYYFGFLAKKMVPHGFEPKRLMKTIWTGVSAMVANNNAITNEECFWKVMQKEYGDEVLEKIPIFEEFYSNEFQYAQNVCGFNPYAKKIIQYLKKQGIPVVLATNPVFPQVATYSRTGWAGLDPSDFEWITTYENIGLSKPNPDYYAAILEKMNYDGNRCLMVGNDVSEDLTAKQTGMDVYLVTDCLINNKSEDISEYKQGSLEDLYHYLGGTDE